MRLCRPIPGEAVHNGYEAAKLLGIRRTSIPGAVRDGLLRAWQPDGWHTPLFFPQSAIDEYLARPTVIAARTLRQEASNGDRRSRLVGNETGTTSGSRSGPKRAARLSMDPLLELAAAGMPAPNARKLAVVLHCSPTDIWRWLAHGVTWTAADRLAVRLGYHPAEVWGADWWALDDGMSPGGDIDDDETGPDGPSAGDLAAAKRRHPSASRGVSQVAA